MPLIAIDARLREGQAGGVEQVVIGLAHGLAQLDDGDEEYLFVVLQGHDAWLRPHLGPNARVLEIPAPGGFAPGERFARVADLAATVAKPLLRRMLRVPPSDGTIEKSGAALVHFTSQSGFLTSLPTIYQPHDLQHEHFPQYFRPLYRLGRQVQYARLIRQASRVVVAAKWVKEDLIAHGMGTPERIEVIALAPVLGAYRPPSEAERAAVRRELDLPGPFLLYPAQTWEHKNHLGLLEALARLRRERGIEPTVVCTGTRSPFFFARIEPAMKALRLAAQVRFPGYVPPGVLNALYGACTGVILPTLFEAASFPLWEAFLSGAPAACSAITSLPGQAGDAALLFDPRSSEEMAFAIARLWTDGELRRELGARGKARVAGFTWDRTARHYRALYRRILDIPLTAADQELLAAPPLL